MADYDWPAIARATGWEYQGGHRPFCHISGNRYDPKHSITDAIAALEATGCAFTIDYGDWSHDGIVERIYECIVENPDNPIDRYESGKTFCTAACRALEAYGKALMAKEEDDDDHKAVVDALVDALEIAHSALDCYADVLDGPDGEQVANPALSAMTVVEEALAKAGRE